MSTEIAIRKSFVRAGESAGLARASMRRVCEEAELDGEWRDDVVLMLSELVADAALCSTVDWVTVDIRTQYATLETGELTHVLLVGVQEVVPRSTWSPYGYTQPLVPPRRFVRGQGLGIVAEVVAGWPGGECGWFPGSGGPTSWFLASGIDPGLVTGSIAMYVMPLRGYRDENLLTAAMLGDPGSAAIPAPGESLGPVVTESVAAEA
ncbi:hypothetical protein [Streptomyces sp. SID3343]|uniref:hypothetical protein n=1 Tax=Streptomyces sp. SID3343 TaxID=2690260 RepID=UPI00136E6CEA|nr:hypothetical protein [Streptomyces sp. SID3343]MYV99065.1 hypothetical protein [Streptomyces sp. SID3343]